MFVFDIFSKLKDGNWKTNSNITIVNSTGGRITLNKDHIFGNDDKFMGTQFHKILNLKIEFEGKDFVVYLSKKDI